MNRQYLEFNNYGPKIIFSNITSRIQEKLVYNLKKLPSVKVAFGVGGSFDYLSKRINRGPKIFRQLGLEWLWRLINAGNFKDSQQGTRILEQFSYFYIGS